MRLTCGKYYTVRGRVLGITAIADTLEEAIGKVYEGMSYVSFQNLYYRSDIEIERQH